MIGRLTELLSMESSKTIFCLQPRERVPLLVEDWLQISRVLEERIVAAESEQSVKSRRVVSMCVCV